MNNHQILTTRKDRLTEVDRQRQFLLRVEGSPMPCPACKKPVNVFQAAGITLEEYDFGKTTHTYRCPACGAELEQVVPVFASGGSLWHWHLKDSWLQEQLRKAKAFDTKEQPGQETKAS
jgi:hypothetical protein